jgi:hypothetical protein
VNRWVCAWLVALMGVAMVGWWGGGAGSWAQEAGTPHADADRLLTQVADAQRAEDALLAELAAARASELAAAAATTTALTAEVAAAAATQTAQASEIAVLQTRVAELEAAQTPIATPAPVVEVGLNEVAHAGSWDVTVTQVERHDALDVPEGASPPTRPQGVFLLVTLNLVNTGTDAQTYDPTWFQVRDDRDRMWLFDFSATDTLALAGAGTRQYHSVPPGLPTEAVVVFDVPPDATGLSLGVAEDLAATSEPQPFPFAIRLE